MTDPEDLELEPEVPVNDDEPDDTEAPVIDPEDDSPRPYPGSDLGEQNSGYVNGDDETAEVDGGSSVG